MNEQNFDNRPNGPDDFHRFKSTVAKRNMSTAALFCSIAAVVTFQLFFISLPLAGAAVILALLSRGNGPVAGRAKIALIGSIAAFILTSAFTTYAVRTVYKNPALRRQMEQLYEYYTGQSVGTQEPEAESPSENPQQILQDILSGKYREEQGNAYVSGDGESGGTQNGGSFI